MTRRLKHRRRTVLAACFAVVVLAEAISAAPLWTALKGDEHARALGEAREAQNRRLQSVSDMAVVKLDMDALNEALPPVIEEGGSWLGRNIAKPIEIGLPDGIITCTLRDSQLLHENLKAKFPELFEFSGICSDGSHIFLNGERDRIDGLGATLLTTDNDYVYVDSARRDSNLYTVYKRSAARAAPGAGQGEGAHGFSCSAGRSDLEGLTAGQGPRADGQAAPPPEAEEGHKHDLRRLRALQNATSGADPDGAPQSAVAGRNVVGYMFRIAIVTTREYSVYHGNRTASVLQSLANLLARSNGIYMRELGIYFQLIDGNDRLICLDGDPSCESLPNAITLLDKTADFMALRGIPPSAYDLAHGLATRGGGRAAYPGLCNDRKAEGMTGLQQPDTDAFFVDYFSHEVGHQLLGAHSFRDCGETNFMADGAVEPGSGSSIMGYAGICPGTNLQSNSDPYFNSNNLVDMRAHIESTVARSGGTCGSVIDTGRKAASVVGPSQCTVPVGNRFQLRAGEAQGTSDGADIWYAWDRVDRGPESFADRSVARFRSWKPRRARSRFFPSMYFTTFGLEDSQLLEILPSKSQEMTFRLVGRQLYDTAAIAGANDANLVGSFAYSDTVVQFTSDIQPLVLAPIESLTPFQTVKLEWDPGSTAKLAPRVKIHMAVNDLVLQDVFDYELHEKELIWFIIADDVENTGSAVVSIPQIQENKALEVHVMIRSSDSDCFFYDIATRVTLTSSPGKPNAQRADGVESGSLSMPGLAVIIVAGIIVAAACLVLLQRKIAQQPAPCDPYDDDIGPPAKAKVEWVGPDSDDGGDPEASMPRSSPFANKQPSLDGATLAAAAGAKAAQSFAKDRASARRESRLASHSSFGSHSFDKGSDGAPGDRTSYGSHAASEFEPEELEPVGPTKERAAVIASFARRLSQARRRVGSSAEQSERVSPSAGPIERRKKEFAQEQTGASDDEQAAIEGDAFGSRDDSLAQRIGAVAGGFLSAIAERVSVRIRGESVASVQDSGV